ncbi:BsuPI-related putative proteinase inhibitor [Natrialba asiatica]|uniref:Intracellular proteinase inhibitor BsuPI domain-containing protein n=1 Tax=Natrialba asiatica (strain ATCC 700177 / DSM 12278 / JCM 9576 / FERM P-10747 / NBRC 102637 / 172P1) TaxID=29540 RepID=M0API6_NATA1|nr:BsuPI-related putative proteinase inhibitor [Natrialba asiatica]ELZ00440.1 hypothetical protein C481_12359 [Natrialba asiatica DSM 12278]
MISSLTGSLEAATPDSDAGVVLTFTVRNEGPETITIQFTDACKADFAVADEETGREVWRFTDGRMFAQLLSADELEPGEATTYEAEWENPQSGEFTVVAELRARETTCEARTALSV